MPPSPSMCFGTVGTLASQSKPRCIIVEEPAPNQVRFRYECEGKSAGSIPGATSTAKRKTYPSIKVEGYVGKAVVVVSCVTRDPPFRPHPHNIVGRKGCKKGVCTVEFPEDTMTVSFRNLGIQCVKRKDVEEALKTREEIKVDPFRTGFSHRESPLSIDLNSIRLCFQVLLRVEQCEVDGYGRKKFRHFIELDPVVSNPIYHKKLALDLKIVKLSDEECPVDGGNKEMILLCEKVNKEDIQIRFYEQLNGRIVWEAFAEFQPSQVHKQCGICFRPPRYKNLEVMNPVDMFIQLRRPTDGATSTPLPFQMMPLENSCHQPQITEEALFHQQCENNIFNLPTTCATVREHDNFAEYGHNFSYHNNMMMTSSTITNKASVSFYNIPPEEIPDDHNNWKSDLLPITIDSGDLTMTDLSHRLSSNLSLSDQMMTCSS